MRWVVGDGPERGKRWRISNSGVATQVTTRVDNHVLDEAGVAPTSVCLVEP